MYEAAVVGYDEDKDVAVLHIDAPKDKLRPIPVGTSGDLLVGQKVYAIGNPVGKLIQCHSLKHGQLLQHCLILRNLQMTIVDGFQVPPSNSNESNLG